MPPRAEARGRHDRDRGQLAARPGAECAARLEDADQRPALDVRINRVAARVQGGLVHLQTTREEPSMDSVAIDAEDSILSTVSGDNPLFRLEGQDQLEQLRDRVRWVGHNVAYHRIKTYRRDEIVQAGGLPRIYDRDDWTRAFLPTDDVADAGRPEVPPPGRRDDSRLGAGTGRPPPRSGQHARRPSGRMPTRSRIPHPTTSFRAPDECAGAGSIAPARPERGARGTGAAERRLFTCPKNRRCGR